MIDLLCLDSLQNTAVSIGNKKSINKPVFIDAFGESFSSSFTFHCSRTFCSVVIAIAVVFLRGSKGFPNKGDMF